MSASTETMEERSAKLETRQRRLAARAQALRTRAGAGAFDRWMLVVGGTFVALGVLLVILGWVGASDTIVVFEQIPYLISGGLLGLALVFAGAFVYFAYWLTLIVRDTRDLRRQLAENHQRLVDQQERIGDTLATLQRLFADAEAARTKAKK